MSIIINTGKQPGFKLAFAVLLAFSIHAAHANPTDPTVVSGQSSFATSGNTLTVTNKGQMAAGLPITVTDQVPSNTTFLGAGPDGASTEVRARALVNVTGPWVKVVREEVGTKSAKENVRHVKGSHIVVPRIHEKRHAYILQNPDRRIVFAIPFEGDCTLIGTTERDYAGDLATPGIEPADPPRF